MLLILRPFGFSIVSLAVVLCLVMTALFFVGCTSLNHATSKVADEPAIGLKAKEVPSIEPAACEVTLTDRQVIDIANRVIEVTSGEPGRLEDDFDLVVLRLQDCQYMLSGIQDTSTLHFGMMMTASGEILSPPWCCVPGSEVDVSDLIPMPKQPSPKP